jgi:UDP-glucose 4-epimerase
MRGCDAVVHFAAESHVDRSIDEPLRQFKPTSLELSLCLRSLARSPYRASFTFPPMKSMATSLQETSPAKILRSSQAVPIPPPRRPRTSWFAPTCAPTNFPL